MELQDVIEAGYSVDDFLDNLVEVNENSKGILLDDFVLTMSNNESNHLTTSSNHLTNIDK